MWAHHAFPYVQHGGPLVAYERVIYIKMATRPPPMHPSQSPTIPPLCTPPLICDRGRQRHLWSPIFLMRSNKHQSVCAYGGFTPTGSSTEAVDPSNIFRFFDSFHAVAQDITKGLSASQAAAANGHWPTWAKLYIYMYFEPPLVLYRDAVPILNTFMRQYQTGALYPAYIR